jgi:hypothetical protein
MATLPINPSPGTTANPPVSFGPNKDYLSFSSIINEVITPVFYTNAGANTLLYSDLLGGFITHTAAGAETDTLPSAAILVPEIQGAQVGSAICFYVKAGGAGTITIAPGAGGTAEAGDTLTIATTFIRLFMLIVTALPDSNGNGAAYKVYSLGASTY